MSQYGWRLQENDYMQDTFEMLEELLEQEQFELLFPTEEIERDGYSRGEYASGNEEEQAKKKNSERTVRKPSSSEIRLVYLMNDAVESFLIFRKARLTGSYISDYEGFLKSSLNREGDEYILVVWQGENVVTLFFQDLDLEVHLYNYGEIGHFWVPEYEYLRQLEYRIAIARDKLEYLGQEFCTEEEQSLVQLADFPPLNYCCYPAVPRQYIVPKEDPWIPSAQAFQVMEKLIKEVQDYSLLRLLQLYEKFPSPLVARIFARALHKTRHAAVVALLTSKIKKEAGNYPNRSFGEKADHQLNSLLSKARKLQEKLAQDGICAEVLREEPFTTARDSLDFQVFLMVWKRGWRNCKVEIRKLTEAEESGLV